MLISHQMYLCCPRCHGDLEIDVAELSGERVKEGMLTCSPCAASFPIVRFIPRFVNDEGNYSVGFGFQWNRHYRTQYDSYTGLKISEERFFNETRWPRSLAGEVILEAGSGSGRFTVQAASTGAMVISFDYSSAVEANYRNNGHLDNVLIVQASIFEMPFRNDYFDRVVCIGVIQHTPDPGNAFQCLTKVLRPGGNIVIDAYRVRPWHEMIFLTKYWVRPITKKLPNDTLYRFCERWVNFWWGVTGVIVKITGRRTLSWFLLIADYRGTLPLPDDLQREWSILDTFDMLSPAYDYPQTIASVQRWFENNGYSSVEVQYGYNGIEGRGTKV